MDLKSWCFGPCCFNAGQSNLSSPNFMENNSTAFAHCILYEVTYTCVCVCVCVCVTVMWWTNLLSLTLSFPAFQRHNGDILTTASVKHLSHRRFVVSFQLDSVQRSDQDLYRCVTQSPRGSGVSNFAELVVKGKNALFSSLTVLFFSLSPFCFFPAKHNFFLLLLW